MCSARRRTKASHCPPGFPKTCLGHILGVNPTGDAQQGGQKNGPDVRERGGGRTSVAPGLLNATDTKFDVPGPSNMDPVHQTVTMARPTPISVRPTPERAQPTLPSDLQPPETSLGSTVGRFGADSGSKWGRTGAERGRTVVDVGFWDSGSIWGHFWAGSIQVWSTWGSPGSLRDGSDIEIKSVGGSVGGSVTGTC